MSAFMTELEAVIKLIKALGESPVSSLATGLPKASSALTTLTNVRKEILKEGWHENTDFDYTLSREPDNRIKVPGNTLRVDTTGKHKWINISSRTLSGVEYLYDKVKKVHTFTQDLNVDIVWLFPYDDLSPAMQLYIAAKASVDFQISELGSIAVDQFTTREKDDAWASLMDAEAEKADYNDLNDSAFLRYTTRRNSRIQGT